MAEDLLLGPVVELGGYEVPVADPAAPAALLRRTDHTGGVALRAELFTGIGSRDAEIDGVLRAPQQRQTLRSGARRHVARWLGYDQRSYVGGHLTVRPCGC